MDEELKKQIQYLGLNVLAENWDGVQKEALKKKPSYQSFLSSIVKKEYLAKIEKARLARIKRATIPENYVMETFPFDKQPKLDKKLVYELYDSLNFIEEKQDLIFIGPTGCGKTGLATAFLLQAISKGYRGLFVDFSLLISKLYQSRGDHSEERLIKNLSTIELLLIDELGYISCKKEQASLFFDLMRRRSKKTTTIITTQLGFEEWGNFLYNQHITAALLDRITVNCALFNMKDCISIRAKKIMYAFKKEQNIAQS